MLFAYALSLIHILIVPVHNTAQWLDRCVESVRAQTLRDIEIILVENRSTDASPELCDAYPAADARIRVLDVYKRQVLHKTTAALRHSYTKYHSIQPSSAPGHHPLSMEIRRFHPLH